MNTEPRATAVKHSMAVCTDQRDIFNSRDFSIAMKCADWLRMMCLNETLTNAPVCCSKVKAATSAPKGSIALEGQLLCLSNHFWAALSGEVKTFLQLAFGEPFSQRGAIFVKVICLAPALGKSEELCKKITHSSFSRWQRNGHVGGEESFLEIRFSFLVFSVSLGRAVGPAQRQFFVFFDPLV